jgi:antitoxin component of MazEF toxin-antitoxin module
LPQEVKNELGIKLGDSVMVGVQDETMTITPIKKKKDDEVDLKFAKMVDEFINDHEDVLKELANR